MNFVKVFHIPNRFEIDTKIEEYSTKNCCYATSVDVCCVSKEDPLIVTVVFKPQEGQY